MAPAELRPEVEQAVPRIDLAAPKGEPVGRAVVDAGLARDRDPVAGLGGDPRLTLAVEPRRIGERPHDPPEAVLELPLRARDLLAGRRVVQRRQIRMGQRMGLEPERAVAVELDDVVPVQERRLLLLYQENDALPSVTAGATKTVA